MIADKVDFGTEESAMQDYFRQGEARAAALGNRGPLRYDADGRVHADILNSYREHGFYVLEGVIDPAEVEEARKDIHDLLDRLPTDSQSKLDRHGRPAATADLPNPVVFWTKPLGDPLGGTGATNNRAAVRMIEPEAAADAPKEVPMLISGLGQFSDPALRISGHPGLLSVASALNGEDFVPFGDSAIVKQPGRGGSFAWHQDGTTHWDSPDWDPEIHGFNFMVQLYPCTSATTVWFVPGSHRSRADIRQLVEQAGGNRLPQAVPLICEAGDVCISNRQVLHGSFPNTSSDWRVSLTIGFHRRASVEGVTANHASGKQVFYDSERVERRAEMISYAIDARRRRFPDETPFVYRPHADAGLTFAWDAEARRRSFNYQARNLFI